MNDIVRLLVDLSNEFEVEISEILYEKGFLAKPIKRTKPRRPIDESKLRAATAMLTRSLSANDQKRLLTYLERVEVDLHHARAEREQARALRGKPAWH